MRVMRIVLNGDEHRLDGQPTVTALLAQAGYADREVVPRSLHPTHLLAEGDVVEIIHAIGGG